MPHVLDSAIGDLSVVRSIAKGIRLRSADLAIRFLKFISSPPRTVRDLRSRVRRVTGDPSALVVFDRKRGMYHVGAIHEESDIWVRCNSISGAFIAVVMMVEENRRTLTRREDDTVYDLDS